jgi:hypothetical protein
MGTSTLRLCWGDSGGGAFKTDFSGTATPTLVGITSGIPSTKTTSRCIPTTTSTVHFSSMHKKVTGWLMPAMKRLQGLGSGVPFKCHYYDGVYKTVDTKLKRNVSNAGSYFYCDKP